MAIKINYLKKTNIKNASNIIVFVNDRFSILNLKKYISSKEIIYIKDLLQSSDLKKNMFVFEVNSKRKIILISIKNDLKTNQIESLGAELYARINYGKNSEYFINSDTVLGKSDNFIGHFLHGLRLKSYEFNKYKSKKPSRIILINVIGNKNKISSQNQLKFRALEEGTFFERDIVSEPENILHPDEYAKRINALKKFGLKIGIYDEKKIKKTWYEFIIRCWSR